MSKQMFRTAGLDPETETLAHRVIGAGIEVHRALGPGFLESVYENALSHELTLAGINFSRQAQTNVHYKGEPVGKAQLDLLVEDKIILELKAVELLAPIHEAQLISYLRATNLRLGLLMNFNAIVLKDGIKRIVL